MPTDEPHGKHIESWRDCPEHDTDPRRREFMRHRCRWCEAEWADEEGEDMPEHEDGCPVQELDDAIIEAADAKKTIETFANEWARAFSMLCELVDTMGQEIANHGPELLEMIKKTIAKHVGPR